MASAEEGYDDERFEYPVPQNLHCSICLNVLKQPMQCLKNEHSFCKPCITRHLQQTQRCPICIEPLTLQTLRPSRLVADLISELKISCDNSRRGCCKLVKLEVLEVHVADCEFSPVQCSNDGCDVIMNRKDQPDHEMNECNFRLAECRVCGERVNYWERKLHCYVTRKEMDEVMNQMGDMKCRNAASKEEFRNRKREYENDDRLLRSSVAYFENNVGVRENIIIAGGHWLQSVEMFNWTTRQWTPLPPMTSERFCSSSFVHQGQMFVCGGLGSYDGNIKVLKLMEEGAQWKNFTAKLPHWTYGHTSVVYENNLFIFGGFSNLKVVNEIYKVCLVSPYSCQLVCRMSEPRMFHSSQRFGDKVVVVGGTTTGRSSNSLDTVLLYDITNNCCQTLAPLPFAVSDMATVAWKDNIIIIGGRDKNGDELNTVVEYNIRNKKSKMLPPMKHKRRGCSAVFTGNVIVVMGGKDEKRHGLNSVECFNVHSYTWEELPSMKEKRWFPTAVVKNIS